MNQTSSFQNSRIWRKTQESAKDEEIERMDKSARQGETDRQTGKQYMKEHSSNRSASTTTTAQTLIVHKIFEYVIS